MTKSKKNKEITCEGACNSCAQKDLNIFAGLEFDEIKRACDLYARAHTTGKYSGVPADKIKDIDPKAKRITDKYDKEHKGDPDANEEDWTLRFSKHQMNLANIWMTEHRKHCPVCKAHDKASKNGIHPCGGWCEFSFDILPTSIATLASIKCNECGAEYYLDEV